MLFLVLQSLYLWKNLYYHASVHYSTSGSTTAAVGAPTTVLSAKALTVAAIAGALVAQHLHKNRCWTVMIIAVPFISFSCCFLNSPLENLIVALGLLLPYVPSDLPSSDVLRTYGNVLTLLLISHPLNLCETAIIISYYLLKRITTPT